LRGSTLKGRREYRNDYRCLVGETWLGNLVLSARIILK
jgi:hypothetical protein